jgi:hypothetical protein
LSTKRNVIIKDVDKTVMFQEATISGNADISKDKRSIYRYNKLSREDKQLLYADRPDLNPVSPPNSPNIREPLLKFADQPSSPVKDNSINPRAATPAAKQQCSISPPQGQSPTDSILADAISISSPTHKSNIIPMKSNQPFGVGRERSGSESSNSNPDPSKASSFVKAVAWLGGMEVIGPAPSGSVSCGVDVNRDNNDISTNINDDDSFLESVINSNDEDESSDDEDDYEDEELSLSS